MHIAILGAGYSGLALCWHLLNQGAVVTLYDPSGLGGGASGMAAGLLHPYMGLHAKKAWQADRALQYTQELVQLAQAHSSTPIIRQRGIVRLALTEVRQKSYKLCSEQHKDVFWWEPEKTTQELPAVVPSAAIYIQNGLAIDSKAYLEGLWQCCKAKGAVLVAKASDPASLPPNFDAVVVAAGYATKHLIPQRMLPLRPVKGQLLRVPWPQSIQPLICPVNSHVYIMMASDQQSCLVGATYEKTNDATVDLVRAWKDLQPKVRAICPALAEQTPKAGWAGVRCSTPSHLPLLGQASDRLWFFAGLGSKGLLYHAWLGYCLSQAILTDSLKALPSLVKWPSVSAIPDQI